VRRGSLIGVASLVALMLAACGGGDDNGTDADRTAPTTPPPETTTPRKYEEGTVAGVLSRDADSRPCCGSLKLLRCVSVHHRER
ncbi:MAG: hypothetical protein ACRDHO_10700, partial [Actinomycetota bacterium]